MFLDLAKATLERTQESAQGDLRLRQQAIADMIGPVRESLDKVERKMGDFEIARAGAHADLAAQVRALIETQGQLRSETSKLVTALRSPSVRGVGARCSSDASSSWRECWNIAISIRNRWPSPTTAGCDPTYWCACLGAEHYRGCQGAPRSLSGGA